MESFPLYSITPFVLMLSFIAVGPLAFSHWWESNRNKLIISLALSIPTAIYLIMNNRLYDLEHQLIFDYIPFIILLGGLFVVTGGIFISGDIEAKPLINTVFLSAGAVFASFMGTTGAAMLLIRTVININSERKFKSHTILFFIAIVANIGGLLTPLGDPPLFLLYLRGVPFTWFFTLLPEWLFANGILLLLYYFVDSYFYKKEPAKNIKYDKTNITPIKIEGKLNFFWLTGIILSVAFLNKQYIPQIEHNRFLAFIREGVILSMAILSIITTAKKTRTENRFTWHPIIEVAYLFLGIFITMVPALIYLNTNSTQLGLVTEQQFFYATGMASSFLDNAPAAVAFHSLALGLKSQFDILFAGNTIVAGIPVDLLKAISVGSVFFGAMTYIGNGPNFMVKAIAEENKIKMPDFFSYMIKFSILVLLPIFILVQLFFI
ncbi:MAG: sodium:proton antiporter [Bacteroidota bacterium]